MANPAKMMKEFGRLQKKMEEIQDQLAKSTVEFSSGGGAVKVTASGDGQITAIKIDPAAVDPNDITLLEDMVLSGVQGALEKSNQLRNTSMGSLTSGLGGLPGMGGMPGLPGFM